MLFGLDRFFNWTVDWPESLASWTNDIMPGSAQDFMYLVGVVEIVAGLVVLLAPRIGGFLVAGWLAGIIVNLLTNNPPEYYDIALRDFGLFLAALALGRLALAYRTAPARRRGAPPNPRIPWSSGFERMLAANDEHRDLDPRIKTPTGVREHGGAPISPDERKGAHGQPFARRPLPSAPERTSAQDT
jgi:hypothetical protein